MQLFAGPRSPKWRDEERKEEIEVDEEEDDSEDEDKALVGWLIPIAQLCQGIGR